MSRENSLVSAQWVEDNLDNDKIVLVEVDEDTTAYDKGHIQGAIKLDWTTDLQDQVRRDFVNKEQFEALLSSKGVANDDTIVLYGGNNNWFAAYAYWYFKLYGHDDVKLLDGGRKKWELDSRELVPEVAERTATTYTAKELDRSIRAFRDEVVVGDALGRQELLELLLVHDVAADRVLQLGGPVDLHGAGEVAPVVGGGVFVDLDEDDPVGAQVLLRPVGGDQDVLAAHAVAPCVVVRVGGTADVPERRRTADTTVSRKGWCARPGFSGSDTGSCRRGTGLLRVVGSAASSRRRG